MKEKNFSDFLKEWRALNNLSQEQIAELLQVHRNSIKNWESGISSPKPEKEKVYRNKMEQYVGTKEALSPSLEKPNQNILHVPLYAYGGFMQGYPNPVFMETLEKYSMPGVTGLHFSFEIAGMSMYRPEDPRSAAPGDYAISRPEESISTMVKGKGYILQCIEGISYKIFEGIDGGIGIIAGIYQVLLIVL